MAERDREALAWFLSDLRELLGQVAEDPRDLIYAEHRENLREAWWALMAREPFEQLAAALRRAEIDEELEALGLSGAELKLKLGGYYL